jgi:hypothetical protein
MRIADADSTFPARFARSAGPLLIASTTTLACNGILGVEQRDYDAGQSIGAAGGSSAIGGSSATGGGSGGNDLGGAAGAGGSHAAGGAAGASCNNLANVGNVVPLVADGNSPPGAKGGVIPDGTYVLTDLRAYNTGNVPDIGAAATIVFESGHYQEAFSQYDSKGCSPCEARTNGSFMTAAEKILVTLDCSSSALDAGTVQAWETYSVLPGPALQLFTTQSGSLSITFSRQP